MKGAGEGSGVGGQGAVYGWGLGARKAVSFELRAPSGELSVVACQLSVGARYIAPLRVPTADREGRDRALALKPIGYPAIGYRLIPDT